MTTSSTDSSNRLKRTFPILIIEDNPEHQLVIGCGLDLRFPQANPIFVQTASQALAYLLTSSQKEAPVVRLILLDIYLPQPEIGWQLLKTIRLTYPYIPVIAISSHPAEENVQEAYNLGVHSFIAKPMTSDQWTNYFDALRLYWAETVTLPTTHQL